MSIKYGTRYMSPEHDGAVRASMPPPPVAMAASKLRIQTLQEQLKQKDRIIHALEAEKHSHLAFAAEKARMKELAKMNKGWRKHNANPHTPWLYRMDGTTQDETGKIKTEKVIFVTEYKSAMETIKKMNAEAGQAEAKVQRLRAEQRDAYRKTQELVKVAEELKVKVAKGKWRRIAKSSPEENQGTTTGDGNTTDLDGDVDMEDLSTATALKNVRLVLNPPQQERSLSMKNIRPTRLRLSQPKREWSLSVEEIQLIRLRLSQPKRKDFEEIPVSVEDSQRIRLRLSQPKRKDLEESPVVPVPAEAFQPTRLRLSQPRAEKVGEDSHRVRSGRILKASAKAKK